MYLANNVSQSVSQQLSPVHESLGDFLSPTGPTKHRSRRIIRSDRHTWNQSIWAGWNTTGGITTLRIFTSDLHFRLLVVVTKSDVAIANKTLSCNMRKTISTAELLESRWCILGTIVGYQLTWDSMLLKDRLEVSNNGGWLVVTVGSLRTTGNLL